MSVSLQGGKVIIDSRSNIHMGESSWYVNGTDIYCNTYNLDSSRTTTLFDSSGNIYTGGAYNSSGSCIDIDYKRVGGTIFYIDSSASGSYVFYDSNKNVISSVAVGDTPYYYSVTSAGSTDKYYVADLTNGVRKYDKTNYVMWATNSESLSSYSSSFDVLSSSSTTVGTGKRNTAWILANRNNSIYYPSHNSVSGKITCWDFCKDCNTNSINGCTDWFVPSIGEVTQLRNSGIWGSSRSDWIDTTKYGSNTDSSLWSSSAYSSSYSAWYWYARWGNEYDEYDYRWEDEDHFFSAVVRAF